MIFSGSAIKVSRIENDIAHLEFDLQGESVNKFNRQTTHELGGALDAIAQEAGIQGLLISSRKDVFIVGADITEFGDVFASGTETIVDLIRKNNANFNRIEDLSIPSVVAINGFAMGGGLELCLACDYRLMSTTAKIGLPETKLGLLPGWGGTVRLSRIAGLDTAIEWICGGTENKPQAAFSASVVDGISEPEQLLSSAKKVLNNLITGELPYQQRRTQKTSPLPIGDMESLLAFESAKMFVGAKAGKNYPAPVAAIKAMQDGAKLDRDAAQAIETQAFVDLVKTPAATNLVGLFLSDQFLMKKAKGLAKKSSQSVARSAVLGAGIMGGGIAYQSASRGVPIKMKDIAQEGLDAGLSEANKLLLKRVNQGKISTEQMAQTLNRIEATLSYEDFDRVDLVVEAVVESVKVKQAVLPEAERKLKADAVLCSNTSTISIDELASTLERPENFCGLHFFNPVHAMPLVEVIKGAKTAESAVAKTVAYALALGKKPVVINNCPGFLVNRVLFPYFAGFAKLTRDGANFEKIDKVMERWGWPMGPAYLLDVVGMDTAVHAQGVMAKGFPERMQAGFKSPSDIMFEANRLGQKNGCGFYRYEADKKGKPVKKTDEESHRLLAEHYAEPCDYSDEDIIARTLIPMATELARCLEEGVVDSPAEADMALIYGLGFPPFRGGIFRWIDDMGINAFIEMSKPYQSLGPLYEPTEGMREMAKSSSSYYGN